MWLVTGASGFVGGTTLATLRDHGCEAEGIVRRAGLAHTRVVETWSQAALELALQGATAVVHAASLVHKPETPTREYTAFNVEATRNLLEAAAKVGVRRFVFLSSVKVHGEDTAAGIDAHTPARPDTVYAQTKLDAEKLVLDAPSSLSPVVLRLCPVFGVGDKGNVRMMIRAIARRRFLLPGGGRTRKSIVHVSTVANVIEAALRSERTGAFVLADRETPTLAELASTIARLLGMRPPLSVPSMLLELAAGSAGTALRTLGRRTNLSAELIRKAMTDSVCDVRLTEEAFGLRCHADLETTLREEIAWLRKLGEIR